MCTDYRDTIGEDSSYTPEARSATGRGRATTKGLEHVTEPGAAKPGFSVLPGAGRQPAGVGRPCPRCTEMGPAEECRPRLDGLLWLAVHGAPSAPRLFSRARGRHRLRDA